MLSDQRKQDTLTYIVVFVLGYLTGLGVVALYFFAETL